jgi:hypothetical protein
LNAVITGEMNNAFNRKLRAFFTEFYFFLEYAERKLKRKYGKGIGTSEGFQEGHQRAVRRQLRGYAQHINLPINALSLRSGDFDFLQATTRHKLLVETNRDELLNSGYEWRASDVKPQLRSLPERSSS